MLVLVLVLDPALVRLNRVGRILRRGGAAAILEPWRLGMSLTADDLWPLLAKLPRPERLKLARLALSQVGLPSTATDAERYVACAPGRDELLSGSDDESLAWEAEGWEEFE